MALRCVLVHFSYDVGSCVHSLDLISYINVVDANIKVRNTSKHTRDGSTMALRDAMDI